MYLVERYLGHLKKYVRNKAIPEGSIAEGYIVQEAMTFSSQYLRGVQSKFSMRETILGDISFSYKENMRHVAGVGTTFSEAHCMDIGS